MCNILTYLSSGLVIMGFILYFLIIMLGRGKNVSENSGFDVTKDIISEYDSINIIEGSSNFTVYNIKRKVIRLATSCYYDKNISAISLSLIEAGVSFVDNTKNKFIDIFRIIFPNLKMLYIFAIVAIVINGSTFYVGDAKTGVIFISICAIISYVLLDIREEGCSLVEDNIKKVKGINKDNKMKVINYMRKLIFSDKLIFFGELFMIARMILIILEIK